jgi:ankyrin repeat protein
MRIAFDLKNYSGRTPLSWAVENGNEAVTKQLLDAKAVAVRFPVGSRSAISRPNICGVTMNEREVTLTSTLKSRGVKTI